MNASPADPTAIGRAAPQTAGAGGWSRRRWLTLIAVVFAAHIGLIFIFGEKNQIVPRPVINVPALKLADNSDELLALNDPALFALPNPMDFASAVWSQLPKVTQPSFRFTEPPRWLPLSAETLGATFSRFMRTNYFAGYQLDFKPQPKLNEPVLPVEPAFAQNSTFQIEGEIAQRQLLNEINLPTLPYNDVIAPSVVQVLVDASGDVVSAVLLPSENGLEAAGRVDVGETNAVQIARTLRFAPAKNPAIGQIIFNWRTIPMTTTNDNPDAH